MNLCFFLQGNAEENCEIFWNEFLESWFNVIAAELFCAGVVWQCG